MLRLRLAVPWETDLAMGVGASVAVLPRLAWTQGSEASDSERESLPGGNLLVAVREGTSRSYTGEVSLQSSGSLGHL